MSKVVGDVISDFCLKNSPQKPPKGGGGEKIVNPCPFFFYLFIPKININMIEYFDILTAKVGSIMEIV